MRGGNTLLFVFSLLLAAAGVMLGLWYLSAAGALLAVLSGSPVVGVVLAFFLDLSFGRPVGVLHSVAFPLTLLVFFLALVRAFFIRHLRDRRLY